MRSLSRVKVGRGAGGEALPPVFPTLEREGIRPRRGQVMMIAGQPNGFKSGLALYWVLRLAAKGLTVYYVSADTDPHDAKMRAAAMTTGHRMEDIEKRYATQAPETAYYDDTLAELGTIRFDFETDPDFDHMVDGILAFNEGWGDYPDIVVVDNLMNVVTGREDEWSGMKEVTKGLHRMAWLTGSAVFVLHHQNEGESDPTVPAPRKRVAGKVNQIPELILSIALDGPQGILQVAAVKNRSGKHDATGQDYSTLYVDAPRMTICDSYEDAKAGRAA